MIKCRFTYYMMTITFKVHLLKAMRDLTSKTRVVFVCRMEAWTFAIHFRTTNLATERKQNKTK